VSIIDFAATWVQFSTHYLPHTPLHRVGRHPPAEKVRDTALLISGRNLSIYNNYEYRLEIVWSVILVDFEFISQSSTHSVLLEHTVLIA